MAAVTMHHFSGLAAPFVRSKGTVSGLSLIHIWAVSFFADAFSKFKKDENRYTKNEDALKSLADTYLFRASSFLV